MKTIKELEEAYGNCEDLDEWCDIEGRLKALKDVLGLIDESFNEQRKTTWDEDEEHSCNPIHQSDFIAWHKELKKRING
jgi:hypothetical protein